MIVKTGLEKDWEKFIESNSKDPYSSGALSFMIRWANLMEAELEDGGKLTKKSVENLSDIADVEGISGAMYELSKGYLRHYWQHGEKLQSIFGKKVVIRG